MKKLLGMFLAICTLCCMASFTPLLAATVDFNVNFDDEPDGAGVDETALGEEFIISTGTPDSGATVEEDPDGGSLMLMRGYTDIKSIVYFKEAYTFSVDLISNAENTAVFVKSVEPDEYIQAENPKNQNVIQSFNYYEWDWYQENGGSTGSSIGGSGIYIMPSANSIRIGLKLYQEDGLGVSTKVFELPAPEGYARGKRCTIKVEDTGASVSVAVNGTPLAVVELSEPGTEYATDDPVYGFYKKAVVKDASGKELGTAENTRICSEYSQVALTTRNTELRIDNVSLQYEGEKEDPTPEPSEEPVKPTDAENTAAPTPKATKAPGTTTKAPTAKPSAENDNMPVIIASVIAGVIVIAGITATILIVKKKNKS